MHGIIIRPVVISSVDLRPFHPVGSIQRNLLDVNQMRIHIGQLMYIVNGLFGPLFVRSHVRPILLEQQSKEQCVFSGDYYSVADAISRFSSENERKLTKRKKGLENQDVRVQVNPTVTLEHESKL